jgi:hypothetical protein
MPSLGTLTESQVQLLDAFARPIVLADDTGRLLYQTPALHDRLDRATVQQRHHLQGELDQAVPR